MCLAKPFKLIAIDPGGASGTVDAGGATLPVGLALTPEARVGDYVLVHAGAAIELLSHEEAQSILDAFDEFARLDEQVSPGDAPAE
jgi:hydrogenase expression/formation protein HypC